MNLLLVKFDKIVKILDKYEKAFYQIKCLPKVF